MAAYIKFDGVDGEVVEKDHDKWTELESFVNPMHKPGRGGTGSVRNSGAVVFEDISCSKFSDKSTPKLIEHMASSKRFPKVELHVTTSTDKGQQVYLAYELKDVMITSYSVEGENQHRPKERMTLNYEEFKIKYFPIDSKGGRGGAVEFAWSVPKDKNA